MVRVGIIDSGGPADDPAQDLTRARRFLPDASAVAAGPDRLGHGTAVAAIIRRACPAAVITHAQIFDERPVTSALRVAAALRWFAGMAAGERPDLVCMSLGLAQDRAPLRIACELTGAAGLMLVAAHPAQGAPCYPAAYPGVIAATGDARCGWNDISEPRQGVFGAWNSSPETGGIGGASLGAARIAGHLAARIAAGMTPTEAVAALQAAVAWRGPERRAGIPPLPAATRPCAVTGAMTGATLSAPADRSGATEPPALTAPTRNPRSGRQTARP